MHTMDVFAVYSWVRDEGEKLEGLYQSKEHAEYIEAHLEAIEVNKWIDRGSRFPRFDRKQPFPMYIDHSMGWYVEEEEVYLA